MEELNHLVEPFERFLAYLSLYARDEGIAPCYGIPPSHLPHLRRTAREMGVILHDDGTLELIKQ